jgi:hypothetical protein
MSGFLQCAQRIFGVKNFKFRQFGKSTARAWKAKDTFDGWNFSSSGNGIVMTQKSLIFFDWTAKQSNGKNGQGIAIMMLITTNLDQMAGLVSRDFV